ncbi:acyl carrier protein [Candidatus Hamiltonella defensa]|uniref:Acyl carrier protein n=1 Tax=Candidatus Williamhamiltonella defendens TaxID=138072 RepID=A0AAC9VMB2_9ENTR|nr:acyl carrier protein [Candidatus Hamiltonella defensa]ASV34510.1 acyl carrier protein [Candidatus Hamiltonella defensa]AWK17469.1 acyl carrier protein [Candidatus Hamiltonella defensa]MBK4361708.1 acyl carrier protein [Candidatus Hamiltonella defensa]
MNSETFIENFLSVTDFQNPVEVTMNTLLEDLPEWDSLAALGVTVMFETEYCRTITGDDLSRAKSVGNLFQMLKR